MRSSRLSKAVLVTISVVAAAACAAPSRDEANLTGDYLAGRLAARTNAIDDAARAFSDAYDAAPGQSAILYDAFAYHLAAGDVDGAKPYAAEIVALGGQEAGLAGLALAAHALKAGRLAEARAALAVDGEPFVTTVSFLTRAWIAAGLDGPDAALTVLDAPPAGVFTGFNPLHRALLAEQAGKLDEARAAHQAAAFGLGGPVGRAAYGAFLERAGDLEAARAFYAALASEPGPSRRMAEAAEKRLADGEPSQAFARVEPAQGAAIALYSFAAGMIEQAAGQRARAEEAGFNVGDPRFNLPLSLTRMALYLDPDLDEARRLTGSILNVYGDYEAAAEALSGISPDSPHFEQARIDMASALVFQQKPEEAIALLKDAIARDPAPVELRWTLGNVHASAGQHAEAVAALTTLIDALPSPPEEDAWRYFVSRGASHLELGDWPAAEKDLQRAVEIAPEEPTALNYLGYSWAERGLNLEEAFRLIEKAVALEPQSGAIVDSLGWAHFQLGQYDEAVGHLERAAGLEPGDATITDHLGDVYWKLGRKIEARYQWRRALELQPSDKVKAAIEGKLERGLQPEPRG